MIKESIKNLLADEQITEYGVIPFSVCRLRNAEKLNYNGVTAQNAKSVLFVFVPYYVGDNAERNLSLYAVGRDYHVYFRGFFERMCTRLQNAFPACRFGGSADNAPIDERHGAALAGLGILGDNGLLINATYGSYGFVGEIFSDMDAADFYDAPSDLVLHEIRTCEHCGACKRSCPMRKNENGTVSNPYGITDCLSAVTQTKVLTDKRYTDEIRYFGSAWGCDRCQNVCPHNKAPRISPIPFFHEDLIWRLTTEIVGQMDDETFGARAYAWRKRPCILRNLRLLEEDEAMGIPSLATVTALENVIRTAGDFLRHAHDIEKESDAITEKPGSANFVTVYDVAVQKRLMDAFSGILPDASYLAEEKDNDPACLANGYCFIIDPIDGTTNFIHDYGISAISAGLLYNGTPVCGIIYDPYRDKLYTARRGLGATCNGQPIHVSSRPPEKALYAVGTTPYYKDTLTEKTFAFMKTLYLSGADIRRLGSAALDLAAVASGVADGYCELRISPWDYAAGALLVTEAGGFVSRLDGTALTYDAPCGVIAGTDITMPILQKAVADCSL